MNGSGGVSGKNRQRLHQQHVASVKPGIHLHDSNAGLAVASFNGAVNGCSAAPAWK